jgi:integrase
MTRGKKHTAEQIVNLQWQDVDFEKNLLHVRWSIVEQVVGRTKTAGSNRPLPLKVELAKALEQWKLTTSYAKPSDWVFASPSSRGLKPYWASTLLVRHIRPAAMRAGIRKVIGWHTFPQKLRNSAPILWGNCEDHSGTHAALYAGDDARDIRASCDK